MPKHYSIDFKNLIVSLRQRGKTLNEIAKICGISKATVQTIVDNFKNRGTTERMIGSGRPASLTDDQIMNVLSIADQNPKFSAKEIGKQISTSVTPRTIRNVLHHSKVHSRVACKKPCLTENHKKARLTWALKNVSNSMDQWNRIIWSDESGFVYLVVIKNVWCGVEMVTG